MSTTETKAYAPPGAFALPDGTMVFQAPGGGWQPVATIGAEDQIEDELVRALMGRAAELEQAISRFKLDAMADIVSYVELLAQNYGAQKGGKKGNMTLRTVDGLMEIRVQQADRIEFGPQLQIGKQLLDECMNSWSSGAPVELKTIVTRAFNTDREGQINGKALFMLLRLAIDDEKWKRAMEAIRASIRVVGSKGYVRFYRRDVHDGEFEAVVLDIARA